MLEPEISKSTSICTVYRNCWTMLSSFHSKISSPLFSSEQVCLRILICSWILMFTRIPESCLLSRNSLSSWVLTESCFLLIYPLQINMQPEYRFQLQLYYCSNWLLENKFLTKPGTVFEFLWLLTLRILLKSGKSPERKLVLGLRFLLQSRVDLNRHFPANPNFCSTGSSERLLNICVLLKY